MKSDAEPITLWHCLHCGMPSDTPTRCHICGHGREDNALSLDDGGAAEEQLEMERANPWDSEAENNITRSLRVFRRWEDE